jgi:hypothetical protein
MTPRDLLPLINPKLHPKYSPNLYKWIRKNFSTYGQPIVVTNQPDRYIGMILEDGWMSGVQLNRVAGVVA